VILPNYRDVNDQTDQMLDNENRSIALWLELRKNARVSII